MKFFILGLGSIGKRHAKNLMALGHAVCGYDIRLSTAIESGIEIRSNPFDCDAYIICTPSDQHWFGMSEAVERGKHIFVEKPIAMPDDIERLGTLLEEAERKHLVVMVGNMLRFHPEVIKAKAIIREPISAHFKVLQKNERYSKDLILNWGAHEIDLALHLFGPAYARSAIRAGKRWAFVNLTHQYRMISSIEMDYLREPEIRCFWVEEKDGTFHDFDLRLPDWNDVYMDEMRCFIADISGQETPADWWPAAGENGLATLKIIAEAQRIADKK